LAAKLPIFVEKEPKNRKILLRLFPIQW